MSSRSIRCELFDTGNGFAGRGGDHQIRGERRALLTRPDRLGRQDMDVGGGGQLLDRLSLFFPGFPEADRLDSFRTTRVFAFTLHPAGDI
ncbi:MAG: hypothetical protein IT339_07135 [Thermomicrobiales bacterium]|nr:hypothetical protein [Thermomicrobiales bacterium]